MGDVNELKSHLGVLLSLRQEVWDCMKAQGFIRPAS